MTARTPCCGCRAEEEIREELHAKQRLAKEGWNKASAAVHRRIQERRLDKKWTREMENAIRRFQSACVICGATEYLATHHVQPLRLGHGKEPGNAVRLCRDCNSLIGMRGPRELPPDMARKLETDAIKFKEHWDSGCATPMASVAASAEDTLKAPASAFVALLHALESGDDTAILALADWLEESGDPRARALRAVAKWKIVVQKRQTKAGEARYRVEYRLDGKIWRSMVPITPMDDYSHCFLEERKYHQIAETWRRLGLKQTQIDILKLYLGINSMGHADSIEEIAQQQSKPVQTIRHRIAFALYWLPRLTVPKPEGRAAVQRRR